MVVSSDEPALDVPHSRRVRSLLRGDGLVFGRGCAAPKDIRAEPQPAFCADRLNAAEVMSFLRSRRILRRAATLLTVWSNCLAGWWLGGGGGMDGLPLLFVGASLLYAGGTLWSNAFDVGLGDEETQAPPASSGGPAVNAVQGCGLGLLVVGVICLFWLGDGAGGLSLALAVILIVAQMVRRLVSFSPVLPSICRLMLYLIGASGGVFGVTGWSVWCGLALAVYVLGAVYVLRQRNVAGPERQWPTLLLLAPIALALIVDNDGARAAGLLLSAVLALWTVRSLRPALWSEERDFAGAVTSLVAGIVLVDLLAVADAPKLISGVFIALFLATRALQEMGTRHKGLHG